jgi:hypothetical protein
MAIAAFFLTRFRPDDATPQDIACEFFTPSPHHGARILRQFARPTTLDNVSAVYNLMVGNTLLICRQRTATIGGKLRIKQ